VRKYPNENSQITTIKSLKTNQRTK